jgi:hypothetical protein
VSKSGIRLFPYDPYTGFIVSPMHRSRQCIGASADESAMNTARPRRMARPNRRLACEHHRPIVPRERRAFPGPASHRVRILAGLQTQKFGGGGRGRQRPGRLRVPGPARPPTAPVSLASDRDGLPSSALPDAGERIFMRHHDMWASTFGPVAGLSAVFGLVASRLWRIAEVSFREYPFPEGG